MQQINKTSNMGQKPSKFPHTGLQAASHNGAILIVSLIILLVVTLIATTNMETSILEERMAGNIEDYNLAFQAAEASLEVGENWLSDQILLPVTSPDGTSTVVWDSEGPANMADTADWWQERTDAWWASNGDSITGLTGVASQPQYVIEHILPVCRDRAWPLAQVRRRHKELCTGLLPGASVGITPQQS